MDLIIGMIGLVVLSNCAKWQCLYSLERLAHWNTEQRSHGQQIPR